MERSSFSVELIVESDDRPDAIEARIMAALDVEGIDFDPMTVSVEKIGAVGDDPDVDDSEPNHAFAAKIAKRDADRWEIVESVGGEWMVLCHGVQVGGDVDRSGAGNLTFACRADAAAYIFEIDGGVA